MPRLRKGIRADPDAEGSRERGDLSVVQESANGAVDQHCDGQDQSEELTATRSVGVTAGEYWIIHAIEEEAKIVRPTRILHRDRDHREL